MNDFQKLKSCLTELNIEYSVITAQEEKGKPVSIDSYDGEITWDTAIRLEKGIGYFDFYCLFYFLNGASKGHGVWE